MIIGYIDSYSYYINDTINLRLSISNKNVEINIYYYFDGFKSPLHSFNSVGEQQIPDKLSFAKGCNWKITSSLKIPENWKKGLYIIQINSDKKFFYIPFIIKNLEVSDFIILLNTNTWEAYNRYNGASYYRYMCNFNTIYGKKGKIRQGSNTVSFHRPNLTISDEIYNKIQNYEKNIKFKSHLFYGEMYLIDWMHKNSYSYTLITDMDLHNNFPIQNFKCLVLNCHPEYWTKQMTNNVITNAKNIISLAGNVAYRKVIISKNTMIKNNLWSPSTLKKISGSFFTDNDANTYSPYKILNKKNWIFNNININTNYFGSKSLNNPPNQNGCSGHELDKCVIDKNNIIAKGTNIGIKNGNSNISYGGDILYYKINKKKIFSVGSIVFTGGIYTDDIVKQIVINVLNKFIS